MADAEAIGTFAVMVREDYCLDMLADELNKALLYLASALKSEDAVHLVLVGGGSLALLGLITRSTKDLDVAAVLVDNELQSADPLPPAVQHGVELVARALDLAPDWLNPGPTSILKLGLPAGFMQRAQRQEIGPTLVVYHASRFDQIHLKVYAAADHWPARDNKHLDDLRTLSPTTSELRVAATWCRTHDPSVGFRDHQLRPILDIFDGE